MNGEVNISLNELFKLSGQEFRNIISEHKLRLNHTMSQIKVNLIEVEFDEIKDRIKIYI